MPWTSQHTKEQLTVAVRQARACRAAGDRRGMHAAHDRINSMLDLLDSIDQFRDALHRVGTR